MRNWIGVDLDHTLAYYDEWKGLYHIGEPVPKMLDFVKGLIEEGREVKIFTARMAVVGEDRKKEVKEEIQNWCVKHGLPRLDVTNIKDFNMVALYDDRAFQVIPNTGEIVRP